MLEQTRKQVKVIKPTAQNNGQRDLRVAAYCRVSTDSEDQSNSFLAQVKYYTDFISNSANMVLVDIYADEGITGTCVNKRDEFLRMIKDCKIGKIDKIFVKSVSRFARNSLECIENIRILKECNVTVVFENDGIDTESMNSEMILYIKSAFAQSEALAGSKRVTTATRMRMQSGEFNTFPAPYGYKIENNKLVPVLELQPIIEKIFRDYLSGKGQGKIAEELNAIEDTGRVWNKTAIKYILYNEKYVGDSLLQKTYIELALCANNYESTHNIINKNELKVRCVGERFFGEYAYYELFTEEHTQIYMNLKTNAFKRFITKITGWNFHSRDFQQFYALQKKFNANGWTTLDLS